MFIVGIFRRTLNMKKIKSRSLNDSELIETLKVKLKKKMKTCYFLTNVKQHSLTLVASISFQIHFPFLNVI